jgi:hypothetical protein
METVRKGNAAEAAVLDALVQRDFRVLTPFGEGHPYDLAIHLRQNDFLRVQCKCARSASGSIVFNSHGTDHGKGRTSYVGAADLFGVYYPPHRSVFLIPVVGSPGTMVTLRLAPTLNNQRTGIRLAEDYEIDRWNEESLLRLVPPLVFPNSDSQEAALN